METTERIYDVKKIKAEIKVAAAYQVFLKNQRKTEKIVGNREMSPSEATWKHQVNKAKLSAMYIAYGVMRGKDLEEQLKAHASKRDDYTISNARNNAENMLGKYKLEQKEVA